jgi:hypothetical protein
MDLKILGQYILTELCSEKLLLAQCILFLILNVLDGVSTWLVIRPNHYERERNPIARWVFRKLKLPGGMVFFKAVILSSMGLFTATNWMEVLTINIGLLFGNLVFITAVWHNFKVRKKYKLRDEKLELLLNYKVIPE